MRADVVGLLDRLKQTAFRYREFSDSFADLEMWPVFEAILTDVNVVGQPRSPFAAREMDAQESVSPPRRPDLPSAPIAAHLNPHPNAPQPNTMTGLFSSYAPSAGEAPTRPRSDLRAFLNRLSAEHADSHI